MKDGKLCFAVIVGTRGFFNTELAVQGKRGMLSMLDSLGFPTIIMPEHATPTGCVETTEDGIACANHFKKHAEEIDGIIVTLPNFGLELGIVAAIHESKLNVPVLLHAEDDDLDRIDIAHRRDAFCGKLSVANNFIQYGIPFTNTTLHTCKVDSKVFKGDIVRFAGICRVVNGLRKARIGAIGARPADFQTMRVSEKLLQRSGLTVVSVDHSEIIFDALRLTDDDKRVVEKLKEIHAYGTIPASVPDKNIMKQAKYSVVVEKWINDNRISAAAIQCWTSIQKNYGCATCLTMSMLGEMKVPCACEVDVAGAISMLALTLASDNASALLDWNNNYGEDRNKCVNTHCSNYPKSFFGTDDIEISELDVLGASLGKDNCFGAVKGKVRKGPMTYLRVSTDDFTGKIKAYLGEGDFTDDPCAMAGGVAVCSIDNLQSLMNHIVRNGYEHHVGMVRTHVAEILEEALQNYMGWEIYVHK
ncbi:MAG: fucose isomerase [Sphaerochaeta sp.]|nr:fucose isomerase [Sphaerochaeta sp.]